MDIEELDKNKLRQILRASEGFPSQWRCSKAKSKNGSVSPARSGHALSDHISGASSVTHKTKFGSLQDMVDAFWRVLHTSQGRQALKELTPGSRKTVKQSIPASFAVDAFVRGIGQIRFNRFEVQKAGLEFLNCVAVLEGRDRAGTMYLHVQTFYPELDDDQIFALLDVKTTP